MKTQTLLSSQTLLTASCAFTLALASCGGGGGGGAQGQAGLLPGAARFSFEGLDLEETLVIPSEGTAASSDLLLAGLFGETDGTLSLFQTRLSADGEVLNAYRSPLDSGVWPGVWLGVAMGTTEHRGDAAAFTSPVHLWGGLRQDDGGWCADVDLADGRYIEDTVLYEDGAVGALLRRVDPFANKLILTYEELRADGSTAIAVEFPGFYLPNMPLALGLVQDANGTEFPIVAGVVDQGVGAESISTIGVIDRASGTLARTATSASVDAPIEEIRIADAPGAGSAWVVISRSYLGMSVTEITRVDTVDANGTPVQGLPEVMGSNLLGWSSSTGSLGLGATSALHGAHLGEAFSKMLYLAGTTQDTVTQQLRPAWLGFDAVSTSIEWSQLSAGIECAPGHQPEVVQGPAQGEVVLKAVVQDAAGETSTIVAEAAALTGELAGGRLLDTGFIAQSVQRFGDGLALGRISGAPSIAQLELVAPGLESTATIDLLDGAGDVYTDIRVAQDAYWQRGLLAGGSDQGLYVISALDAAARADASGVLTEREPLDGPGAAVMAEVPATVLPFTFVPQAEAFMLTVQPELVVQAPVAVSLQATQL